MIGIMIGVGMSVCPSEYPPTVRMFIWTCVGGWWRHGASMACHASSHGGAHGIQPAGFGTHLIAIEGLTLLFRKS